MNANIKGQINELTKDIHKNAVDHGWYDDRRTFGEIIALCHSELSEALEEHRKGNEVYKIYFEDGKPEGIPIELSDCIIRILDFCGYASINIEDAIMLKHKFNKTRPYKHGNKKI